MDTAITVGGLFAGIGLIVGAVALGAGILLVLSIMAGGYDH